MALDGSQTKEAVFDSLAVDLTTTRAILAVEQYLSRDMERNAAAEAARAEEALRDAERYRSESRTLHDALAARAQANVQLEAELQAARDRLEAIALELRDSQQSLLKLTAQLKHSESELHATRHELSTIKRQVGAYLEVLRTRDWRRGMNQNLFLEWEAKTDVAPAGHGAVHQADCDRLKQTAAVLSGKLIEQDETIAKLRSANAAHAQRFGEAQRAKVLLAAANKAHTEQAAQIAKLQAEGETHEEKMTVLMAHLNEARRQTQSAEADVKRLSDELALKTLSLDQLNEDNRNLRAAFESTRGALEKRESLIRQLEHSESHNANPQGRIQTTIEKLGSAPASTVGPAGGVEYAAELIRINGEHNTTDPLAYRTHIGRALGCDLQIDSTSVSRHHALIIKSARKLIIEDLNSTNGVVVNGRKVSRQILSDGDLLSIGDIQFRCVLKPAPPLPEASPDRTGAP
jgi:chromosome segregation ATPase